jgi:peptidoglycan-associated lipoprotein
MHRNLGLKILSVVAALALVAACSKKPPQTATTAGTGGVGGPAATMQPGTGAPTNGVTPGTQEDLVTNVGDRVFFDTNGYSLSPEAQATLQRQAQWLKTYGNVHVTIEGHCDERGTREYNLALGERRANAVRDFLINLGVTPDRITTISYGKERPVATCSNESCWSQNRRGVTVVQ